MKLLIFLFGALLTLSACNDNNDVEVTAERDGVEAVGTDNTAGAGVQENRVTTVESRISQLETSADADGKEKLSEAREKLAEAREKLNDGKADEAAEKIDEAEEKVAEVAGIDE